MNLSEERNAQKRMELWEAIGLTPENIRLAERYLDMSQPEEKELLAKVRRQDFSGMPRESRSQYLSYVGHLGKRQRGEESARLLRLVAAIGGSSAGFLTGGYGPVPDENHGVLEKEQMLAIWAEAVSNNSYQVRRLASFIETQKAAMRNPGLFLQAMDLCWGGTGKGKLLLAASYLYAVNPPRPESVPKEAAGLLKSLFLRGGKEAAKEQAVDNPDPGLCWAGRSAREVSAWMQQALLQRVPALFAGSLSPAQEEELTRFLRESRTDSPFPSPVSSILNGRACAKDLLAFLAAVTFLALDHSDRFLVFYRFFMAIDLETALDTCVGTTKQSLGWFYKHLRQLEEVLPIPPAAYIRWCIRTKEADALQRLASSNPEELCRELAQLPAEGYRYVLGQIKIGNLSLYRELEASAAGTMRIKAVEAVTGVYNTGREEAQRYLLGEAELTDVLPFAPAWQSNNNAGYYRWNTQLFQNIRLLKDEGACAQVYKRALVLEGLSRRPGYFCSHYRVQKESRSVAANLDLNRWEIGEILQIFTEEGLTVSCQLEILSCIYDGYWSENAKKKFVNESVHALAKRRAEWGAELSRAAREGLATVRFLCIRVLDGSWEEYKETLLSCAGDSAKQVRELLQAVYVSHRAWEPELKAMLASKKSQEREMAARVLKAWGTDGFREELAEALSKEKSKKLQELLQEILGVKGGKADAPSPQAAPETAEETAAALLKGGKKRKVAWAFPLCEVHKKDGQAADESLLAALLVAYADMGTPGVSKEAALLAGELEQKELAACVTQLYDKWMEAGAEAKKKWVLYAFSLHGGEGVVNALYHQIQEWPKNSRGAMACEAVKALALNGSPTALLLVDQIARKFKFRPVKAAAGTALLAAAKQLEISREELEDRIVPNLGFGEDLSQEFDYGPRRFRVVLTPSLELEITDENGKRLKNLPALGKRDDEEKAKAASEAFKALKKQLKTVTANQKLRLEQALSALRLWTVPRWQELFVKNPVMHQFAIGLIWGRYEDGCLKETFRYMEDGSFNTADEEEYTLLADGLVGLVHPIELADEDLAAWKEQLSDYEVTQPIPQLERPVYRLRAEEKDASELARFGGMIINGLSLSGKLLSLGWYRGSVQDGGGYYTFYREDGAVGVELGFSGAFVGGENEEVTVYGACFYRSGSVKRGSYVYDEIKKENCYALGEVSPRYFSEIVLQLTRATAASEERAPYPACKK